MEAVSCSYYPGRRNERPTAKLSLPVGADAFPDQRHLPGCPTNVAIIAANNRCLEITRLGSFPLQCSRRRRITISCSDLGIARSVIRSFGRRFNLHHRVFHSDRGQGHRRTSAPEKRRRKNPDKPSVGDHPHHGEPHKPHRLSP